MVLPSEEGMIVIIEAAVLNKVKRIVVCSSFQNIMGNAKNSKERSYYNYTEEDDASYED